MSRLLSILASHAASPRHLLRNVTWRLPRTRSSTRIVFVVGCPRSGTTLVQAVLSAHDRLFSIPGETGLFSYQNIFARRHFGLSWEENQALFSGSRDLVDFFDRAVRLLASRNGNRTFVEKTPQHVLKLRFLLDRFPRSRFVHVLRDGRDCFASAKGQPGIPQSSSARAFAAYWRRCVAVPRSLGDEPRLMEVRYEDFVRAPAAGIDRLMRFLGLEMEESQLRPDLLADHRRGRREAFRRVSEPISGDRIGRWRSVLTPDEARVFRRVAGDELAIHGYLDPEAGSPAAAGA